MLYLGSLFTSFIDPEQNCHKMIRKGQIIKIWKRKININKPMNRVKFLVLWSLIALCLSQKTDNQQTQDSSHHEIEILRKEIKEIKYYLHELKLVLESQSKEIEVIQKKSDVQGQTIDKLSNEIEDLNQVIDNQDKDIKSLQGKIQNQDREMVRQDEKINKVEGELNQMNLNMKNYLSKPEMTSFLSSVDPEGITALRYLRSDYIAWLQTNQL